MEQLAPPVLAWQVHPARERWKVALLAAGLIMVVAYLAAEMMEHPAWSVFAAGVLVVGCNRFFFSTRYELTDEGITAHYPLKTVRYQWSRLRRFLYEETGGFLSPRARRSFLDEYRGVSLLFGEESDAALIIHEIRSRLPGDAVVREVIRRKGGSAGVERSDFPEPAHRKEPTSCGG